MKLLLIKIGKAWDTLRHEGLWQGGVRVFRSLRDYVRYLKPVGRGDILFITAGVGDSARYRTRHVAEELTLAGFTTAITVQDNPLLSWYVGNFSVFIFHRTLETPTVKNMIKKIKAQGKEIIFETDDLLFDTEFFQHMDYLRRMNTFERKQYEQAIGGEFVADPYVTVATTTTTFLAERLRERGKRVFIVPNKLTEDDLAHIERIWQGRRGAKKQSHGVTVGYFSGVKAHDKDFATITGALLQLLNDHPTLHLLLAGPLEIDRRFDAFASRIKRLAYVPREKHWWNITAVDINLAPLEIGNPFCEAKSELKFFEAGALGVPTVAAATQTFCEAITDGVDGFVAASTAEWKEKLEKLILDPALRQTIGEAARKTTFEKYTTQGAKNEDYIQYLRSKIKTQHI